VAALLTSVPEAAAIARAGGIVVVPTETVYGLAARPTEELVARLFELKRRPRDKSVQLLIPSIDAMAELGEPSPDAIVLAEAFWPGPLTLVVRASDAAPDALVDDCRIGLRVPGHALALDLLARCGPLAATSANLSGDPTPSAISDIHDLFGSSVDAYIDGGEIVGTGSTVVDVSRDEPRVLREGPISVPMLNARTGGRFEPP
jgi:tRNA threonylcarbamoyl adenosine modification protein (Sua5/YciO/YrdC/YwlC family)